MGPFDPLDRRTYLEAAGAIGSLALAGCLGGGGGDGDATTITAGTAPGFPPFEIKEGGDLVGFDIDLLEAVVAETDYTLAGWEEYEFDSLIPALTSERIDVVAAAMTINDERERTIDFTDPYYSADQAIVVREGGDFAPSALEDLGGHPIGAQKGTTGEGVVKDELIAAGTLREADYKAFDNYVLSVQALENGDIDAIVVDHPVAQTFAGQRDVEVAFVYETGENYGFGVREDADDLREALNAGLAAVRDGGRYTEIRDEWFAEA